MGLDRHSLEEAGRLLLGTEWKRPLARLLGPYHPDGPRDTIDPRLPFRWTVETSADPKSGAQRRPVPDWVGPVLSRLLAERADVLVADAERARSLSDRLKGE